MRGIDGVDAPGGGWGNCTHIFGLRSTTTPAIAAGHGMRPCEFRRAVS